MKMRSADDDISGWNTERFSLKTPSSVGELFSYVHNYRGWKSLRWCKYARDVWRRGIFVEKSEIKSNCHRFFTFFCISLFYEQFKVIFFQVTQSQPNNNRRQTKQNRLSRADEFLSLVTSKWMPERSSGAETNVEGSLIHAKTLQPLMSACVAELKLFTSTKKKLFPWNSNFLQRVVASDDNKEIVHDKKLFIHKK